MTGVQTCALRSEEHTSELQSHDNLVCRLLLEKKTRDFRSEEHTSELQSHDNLPCRLLLEKRRGSHHRPLARHAVSRGSPEGLPGSPPSPHSVRQYGFFLKDPGPTEIHTLSLHGALPI